MQVEILALRGRGPRRGTGQESMKVRKGTAEIMRNLPVYIILIFLTVYVMIMYTEPGFFFVLLALVLLLVLEIVSVVWMYRKVSISCRAPEKLIHRKETIPLTIQIKNQGLLPVSHLQMYISYQNEISGVTSGQWVCAYADGHSEATMTVHLESDFCGILSVKLEHWKVSSFLRIFSLTKKGNQTLEIPIFPNLFNVDFEISSKIRDFIGESDLFSKEKPGDDPSEVFDIREFRQGDRLQRVHWKLTARTDDYMVKEYSRPIGYPVVLFLNFSRVQDARVPDNTKEKENEGNTQAGAKTQAGTKGAKTQDSIKTQDGTKEQASSDALQLPAVSAVIEAGLSMSLGLAQEKCWHYLAWCKSDMTIERYAIESEDDVYDCMGSLLYVKPHVRIEDPMEFYKKESKFENFCTFLSINTNRTIEKDGEIYEEAGLDRNTLSGKNFIL